MQNLIRQTELPPKPVLNLDMAEFRTMQTLMIRVQDRAREIRSLQEEVPRLKTQLAETKGIFKGRERKELETKAVVENYNRDLAEWKRQVREKQKPAHKEQTKPPERESVLKRLRQLQAEGRTQKPKRKTHDMER